MQILEQLEEKEMISSLEKNRMKRILWQEEMEGKAYGKSGNI